MRSSHVLTTLIVALGGTTASVVAQTPDPLPEEMLARYGITSTFEFSLYPSTDIEDVQRVRADVTFDTLEQEVELDWWFKADGAFSDSELDVHTVSFQPTAVCRKAGRDPSFFVAGYFPATGDVVIEEWTVQGLALGSVGAPDGNFYSSLAKTVRKRVVLSDDGLDPIRAMVYSTSKDRLLVLEEAAPNQLWAVDPVNGEQVLLFDAVTQPELADMQSAKAVKVLPTGPDGGGCVVVFYPWRAWERGWTAPDGVPDTETFFLMRDEECGGAEEEVGPVTYADYKSRQYPDTWDVYFADA